MNYSSNYSKLLTSPQVLGIFIFTLIVTSGAPFKVLDHAIFEFTVCGMWACSWEINLEPVCQKKNFPLRSRGSSCYKYVQERSPRFFASSHVKIKGHAFPTSDVSWSCDRILRGIVEQDVLFCDVFLWILLTLICFTVAKVCQLHTFSFSSQILYLQVGIAYGSCLYSWAYGAGDFVPCDPTGYYNIHTPWNCHNWF